MADFKNRDEIKAWLRTQPRDVITIIAARGALRRVPGFASLWKTEKGARQAPDIILPSFWAISIALSAGIWLDRAIEIADAHHAALTATDTAYAVHVAHVAAAAAYTDTAATDAVLTDAEAALRAADSDAHRAALATTDVIDVIDAAAEAHVDAYVDAAVLAAVHTFRAVNAADVSRDRDFIRSGGSAKDLAAQPLWLGDTVPKNFTSRWKTLRKHLLALGDDWDVWTQWYQDRIDGKALIEALEIGDPDNGIFGRATFPPEDYKTPAIINAKIKKMQDDYWAERALTQDKSAETFAVNDNGKITVTTQEIGHGLTVDAAQTSWYDELRQAATEALSEGENVLGAASRPIERLAKALPEDITQARTPRLWTCANKIRRLLERHDNIEGTEFNANRLNENAADALRAITDAYNNLRIGDAALLQADERAPNPRDIAEILKQDAPLIPLLEDAIRDDITDAEASEVLQLVLSDIETQNDIIGPRPVSNRTRRGGSKITEQTVILWQASCRKFAIHRKVFAI